jgi:hypothetical protein
MSLQIIYNEKVLFTKEVDLTEQQKTKIVERVTTVSMSQDERVAIAKAQQEAYEKTLTKEQKAERARVFALKPEEKQAELLVKQKTMLEAQLTRVATQITTVQAKLNPIKESVEEVKPEKPLEKK